MLFLGGFVLGVAGVFSLAASVALGTLLIVAGSIMVLVAWIWALISGIRLIKQASE